MRYAYKLALTILMAVGAVCIPLHAGNSIFSYRGAPVQNYGNDTYGMSMGDVGISDVFRYNTGFGNPAVMGSANTTLFSTGLQMGWTTYKTNRIRERSFRDNSLDFPYFSMTFPIKNHHAGFQFNSIASGIVQNQSRIDSTLTETNSVDRYLYRADLLYAYHFSHINTGVGLNYYLGHDILRFAQSGGFGSFDTVEKLDKAYKNPGGSVGITAQWENIAIGAVYNLPVTLRGTEQRSNIVISEDMGDIEYKLASHIGAGITARMKREYKVSMDIQTDLWKNAGNDLYTQDAWKVGIGFAQEPAATDRQTFVGKMQKRFGVSYRILPFQVNGKNVSETALTLGASIPVKKMENRLDVGFQYLMRGQLSQHNMQDRALMFMIGFTGFDIISKDYRRTAVREIPEAGELPE